MKGVATGQLRTVPNQIQFGSLEIQIERAVGPKMALGATFGGVTQGSRSGTNTIRIMTDERSRPGESQSRGTARKEWALDGI